jgi:tRNA (cmo5U34)-methyltransferase
MNSAKDAIYSQPQQVGSFTFDHQVAEVFPDMIQRSVPGYMTIVDNIGQICGKYAQPNSKVFDLGCSLGAVSLAASKYIKAKNCQIIGVDNSAPMVERCKRHVQGFKSDNPIKIIHDHIQNIELTQASVVVMNFTLQFIAPEQRHTIVDRIYQGLRPGGVLILSEKIKHTSATGNELLIDLHHEFKRRNGYSELEISQKRSALEDVMKTDTYETHLERLTQVGFTDVIRWFSCFNFTSMVAIKTS